MDNATVSATSAAHSRRPRLLRWGRGESGQTLVEFALTLPIFIILICALADFGRGFYSWMIVTNAAREGARSAAVGDNSSGITSKIYGSFCTVASPPSGCAIGPAGITTTLPALPGTKGNEAQVTVSYAFTYVTPIATLVTLIGGSSLTAPTITSTTAMRFE